MKLKKQIIIIALLIPLAITIIVSVQIYRQRSRIGMEKIELPTIESVSEEQWQKLAEQKIFFAHMSVGNNIIDGINQVLSENEQITLNLIEAPNPDQITEPSFAHTLLGHNTNPDAKIESFKEIMSSAENSKPDIAFMKFCYIDIRDDSDPTKVFENYKNLIKELKIQNPKTKFLHLTVPLCSNHVGLKKNVKGAIKSILGKTGPIDDNLKRMQYNQALYKEYGETDPIFDIALVESTTPDGRNCYASKNNIKVPMMLKQYTDDGGHLNNVGKKFVAEQLLITLAKLASKE